jgi:hypothetical protein
MGAFVMLGQMAPAMKRAVEIGTAVTVLPAVVVIAADAAGGALATRGGQAGIRFAQRGISAAFRHGEFAGRSIDEVATGLRAGTISSDQLPINVVVRNGIRYTMNNRSLMALRQAGLEPTVINDVTGNAFFERQLTERLAELGGKVGEDFVPTIRKP